MRRAPLKLGIVGCGRIVRLVHLGALLRVPGVEVAALAEPDADARADASGRVPGAKALADYRELLALPGVEAVAVCVPNDRHAEVAVAAFEAGKHVYLEKPIAADLESARGVLRAWRGSGRVGMVGFNYRFHPALVEARRRIAAGAIGEPIAVRSAFTTPARALPEWKRRRSSGGGVLLDLASHHVDLARFLLGREVEEASARSWSHAHEADTASLELRLEGGLPVQSFFSMCSAEEDRFEVFGRSGRLVVDRHYARGVEVLGPRPGSVRLARLGRAALSLADSPPIRQRLLRRDFDPSYRLAFGHFAAAVAAGGPASPDLEDGFRSLAAVAAAEESARTGQPVAPAGVFDEDLARQ